MTARSVRYAVCEAMGSAIPEGFRPEMPPRASSAARADVPEGVAVDTVAADPAVFDTDAAPSYRDRVKHADQRVYDRAPALDNATAVVEGERVYHLSGAAFDFRARRAEAERVRRSRLSRWQETRG